MAARKNTRPAPAKTPAPVVENPCEDCEGSGASVTTARNIRVQGQTAICLTCLGTGEAP